jgi:hypothetical protein
MLPWEHASNSHLTASPSSEKSGSIHRQSDICPGFTWNPLADFVKNWAVSAAARATHRRPGIPCGRCFARWRLGGRCRPECCRTVGRCTAASNGSRSRRKPTSLRSCRDQKEKRRCRGRRRRVTHERRGASSKPGQKKGPPQARKRQAKGEGNDRLVGDSSIAREESPPTMSDPQPLPLSDLQLSAIPNAAQPLPPASRSAFLEHVARELSKLPEDHGFRAPRAAHSVRRRLLGGSRKQLALASLEDGRPPFVERALRNIGSGDCVSLP